MPCGSRTHGAIGMPKVRPNSDGRIRRYSSWVAFVSIAESRWEFPGAVNHLPAGFVDQRARQHIADPVNALHPASIIYIAGGLETRPHGEQVFDGDSSLFGIVGARQILGEKLVDAFVNALQVAAIESNTDEGREKTLGSGLKIRAFARRVRR